MNKHILKTNFYQPTKVALSFCLDGRFLPNIEYVTKLFCVFVVVGGLHVHFRDAVYDGVRIALTE
jgi:glutamate dehydrogenase